MMKTLTRKQLENVFDQFLDRLVHELGNDREAMYQYHLKRLEGLTVEQALRKMPRGPKGRWNNLMVDTRAELRALSC